MLKSEIYIKRCHDAKRRSNCDEPKNAWKPRWFGIQPTKRVMINLSTFLGDSHEIGQGSLRVSCNHPMQSSRVDEGQCKSTTMLDL
jgi:hypothetical protein